MYASMQGFSSVFYKLKKRTHELLLLDLSLNYSRRTKTTQCFSLSVATVLNVYKLNFLYFWVLYSLQALTKPCDLFVKKRELLNPFPADKDRQAMHIQWKQVRKQILESCCRFSLSPQAEQWIALAQNVTVVTHYHTKKKLDKSEEVCLC